MWAVLRDVRRIAMLRVLTAYIPRTPGPKKAMRARAWPAAVWGPAPGPAAQCVISKQFCGVCMEYGGNLRRICEAHL